MRTRRFATAAMLAALVSLAAGAQQAKHESQADLQKEAKVSMADAKALAMSTVPGGTITSSELEREHGKLIYSFDLTVVGKSGVEEVNVDAVTGKLLSHEHESAAAEKKEANQEAAEKKPPTR